jgi:hypothetical protein
MLTIEPEKPTEASGEMQAVSPAEDERLAALGEPVEPSEPVDLGEPGTLGEPIEPSQAGALGELLEPDEPVEPIGLLELDEPVEPDEHTFLQDLVDEARRCSANSELHVLDIDMSDIRILHGNERSYLYSTRSMTDNYANWAFLSQENDVARTLVECAREESRVYPRPMLSRSLQNPPFSLSPEAIEEAFDQVVASGAFPDIQSTTASNGDVYYFSTEYLSPVYAHSLAEYSSVESRLND